MKNVKVRRIEKKEVDAPGLGQKIKEARESSSKSVTQICKEVEVSRAYWYMIENEQQEAIAEETLLKIEKSLNTSFGISFDSQNVSVTRNEYYQDYLKRKRKKGITKEENQ